LKRIIIAIDGYSSCGKSTLAKALAKKLHYAYVDTGAMYRAVTLFFIQNKLDYNQPEVVKSSLDNIEIHFERKHTGNHVMLNNVDVEDEIRKLYVSQEVSNVAAISEVRKALVRQQKMMGTRKGIVMDGRDIGTVVFPEAEVKIFLTADKMIRAKRRHDELINKGQNETLEAILQNLEERDRIDSTRADSPLRMADDAILLDNSFLKQDEQLQKVLDIIQKLNQ
jgi:CMP/dCMP kinase